MSIAFIALFTLFLISDNDTRIKADFWFANEIIFVIVWALLNRVAKRFAPLSIFLYCFTYILMINLSLRGVFDQETIEKDVARHQNSIYFIIMAVTVLNYSSFLTSVVILPTSILIPYYFQL